MAEVWQGKVNEVRLVETFIPAEFFHQSQPGVRLIRFWSRMQQKNERHNRWREGYCSQIWTMDRTDLKTRLQQGLISFLMSNTYILMLREAFRLITGAATEPRSLGQTHQDFNQSANSPPSRQCVEETVGTRSSICQLSYDR